jgi:hypothetical protein
MHGFTMRPDDRCQRGLHLVYEVPAPLDLRRLEDALVRAFDDRLVRSEEAWGQRRVSRLVLQFRFEVRLGVRSHQISLLFRDVAPARERAADQARFEAVLAASLEERS